MKKDILSPIVNITTPGNGTTFGEVPPSFNLTVFEPHFSEKITYNLFYDNNTLIKSGECSVIKSSLSSFKANLTIQLVDWKDLKDGKYTIVFQASDTVGNIASIELTINKNVEDATKSNGDDTDEDKIFGIAPILFVSLIGGGFGAIGLIIFIIIKKRGSE